jgi:hypothetical protein
VQAGGGILRNSETAAAASKQTATLSVLAPPVQSKDGDRAGGRRKGCLGEGDGGEGGGGSPELQSGDGIPDKNEMAAVASKQTSPSAVLATPGRSKEGNRSAGRREEKAGGRGGGEDGLAAGDGGSD